MSHSARIVQIYQQIWALSDPIVIYLHVEKNTLFTVEYKIYVQDMEVNNRTRINSPFLMVESSLRY